MAAKAALAVVDQFVIIPAYRTLSQAAEGRRRSGLRLPPIARPAILHRLRAAYNAAADAWATAQFVKTGPISLFLRYDRFAYWPEARNVTTRTLDALAAPPTIPKS